MPVQYAVPWDLVFGLTPHIANGTRRDVDDFSASVVARMDPAPVFENLENIPTAGKFLVIPNHFERPGVWILHSASAVTQGVRQVLGPGNPPVHWVVTANWPPMRVGPWTIPSPGDILLPKVAHALHCFPVSFARLNPGFTAASIRRLLKAAPTLVRPIGIFPEGVAGTADHIADPLPGVERLIAHLAKLGYAAVPVGIREEDRLIVRFGTAISSSELAASSNAAQLLMNHVRQLVSGSDPEALPQ